MLSDGTMECCKFAMLDANVKYCAVFCCCFESKDVSGKIFWVVDMRIHFMSEQDKLRHVGGRTSLTERIS